MLQPIAGGIVTGVIVGSLYALMATGLGIIWNTTGFLNFWHGGLIAIGAYTAWALMSFLGVPIQFGAIFAFAVTFVLGVILERLIVSPLRNNPNTEAGVIVSTLALGIFTPPLLLKLVGPVWKSLPPMIGGSIDIGVRILTYNDIAIVIISISSLILFDIFLKRSRHGLSMRSIAQNFKHSLLCGVNTENVYTLSFALGSAFAGLSGVLLSQRILLRPEMGWEPLLKGLAIIIVAGKGSTRGIIFAALMLGILESVSSIFVGKFWATGLFFLTMIALLIIRPKGLFGREEVL